MDTQKIAVIVDSTTDIPQEYINKYKINVLPVKVCFKRKSFVDCTNISKDEFFKLLKKEIPKTEIPSKAELLRTFKRLRLQGYKYAVAITASAQLSAMFERLSEVSKENIGLKLQVIDSLSIGMGTGFAALSACKSIEDNLSFDEVCESVHECIKNTKIYFCVPSLEYLKKGGKIGLLTSFVGSALNVKPVISCNENGVCYNVSRARGAKNAENKALFTAAETAAAAKSCNVAVIHTVVGNKKSVIGKRIHSLFPHCKTFIETEATIPLAAYTGSGLMGICVQKIQEA